ncbi:MAG: hypothetical protein N3A69_00795 [Leptospiraceae bacterium]|nr:hypothetical protein [Leptospiraceae bacterium]
MTSHFSIEEIQGQEIALRYAKVYAERPAEIPHLLIFHGPRGTGKFSLAERLAYRLLCLEQTGCGVCESCKFFFKNMHPDYVLFPEGKLINIGNEDDPPEFTVRWLLFKILPYKPHTSKLRIITLPDASLLGQEAETALLKTLEEPPYHTKFFLIVDDLKKLKQTIISRGVCIPFQYLPIPVAQNLSKAQDIYYKPFYGGSLNPTDVPPDVTELIIKEVEKGFQSPVSLLELENFVHTYKEHHPEWKEDFQYSEFLEMFALVTIDFLSKKEKYLLIEKVFEFIRFLHIREVPGLDNFLISQLFHFINQIYFNR